MAPGGGIIVPQSHDDRSHIMTVIANTIRQTAVAVEIHVLFQQDGFAMVIRLTDVPDTLPPKSVLTMARQQQLILAPEIARK